MAKVSELISALPADKIPEATSHLARLDRFVKRQSERDTEIVQAVIRVLKHPAHQRLANELRNLILKGPISE